jgi:hypothetical protein
VNALPATSGAIQLPRSANETIADEPRYEACRCSPALYRTGIQFIRPISRMSELVNQKLPKDQQIEYAYGYPGKMRKIRALYRELYPTGHLARWELSLEVTGFVWLFVVAVILLMQNGI